MVQILVPVADQATGSWTTAPLWSKVDDDSTDSPIGDGQTVASEDVFNTLETSVLVLTLVPGIDPEFSSGHVLRVRWHHDEPGQTLEGNVQLRQGTTDIALLNVSPDVGTTESEATYTLTSSEADAITDYGDLNVQIWGVGSSGGPGRSLIVDLVELEIPDRRRLEGSPVLSVVTEGSKTEAGFLEGSRA